MRRTITSLMDGGFLARAGSYQFRKTPAAIRWLRARISADDLEPEQPDLPGDMDEEETPF
jgi:uncharacterized protein (DUF849 family)